MFLVGSFMSSGHVTRPSCHQLHQQTDQFWVSPGGFKLQTETLQIINISTQPSLGQVSIAGLQVPQGSWVQLQGSQLSLTVAAPQDFTASLWDGAFRPKAKCEACLLVVWVLSGLSLGLYHRGKQLANLMVGKLTSSQFLSLWFPRTGKTGHLRWLGGMFLLGFQ